jgi:hypothetical protein
MKKFKALINLHFMVLKSFEMFVFRYHFSGSVALSEIGD